MNPKDYDLYKDMCLLVENIQAFSHEQQRLGFPDMMAVHEKMRVFVEQITYLQEAFSPEVQEHFSPAINKIVESAIIIQRGIESGMPR
jgi:hypothetical protein